jgi:hypothetical protein
MECYADIKKNEIMLFSGKWMVQEIMLNGIYQTQKGNYCMFSLTVKSRPKMMMVMMIMIGHGCMG